MDPTRRARLAAVIQEELSKVVARELKDPRIPSVVFTRIDVVQDGSQATCWLTILGASAEAGTQASKDQRMKECITGLISASGFLRRHLASVLTVRHIPNLIFKEDRGYENTVRVHELLKEISSEPKTDSENT
jgi:ribosome-binding factor A